MVILVIDVVNVLIVINLIIVILGVIKHQIKLIDMVEVLPKTCFLNSRVSGRVDNLNSTVLLTQITWVI
jgi:hypothetical protein